MPWHGFRCCVARYHGNRKVKSFAPARTYVWARIEVMLRPLGLHDLLSTHEDDLKEETLPHAETIMSVFPCRISIRTNIRYRLYCEPADRPSKAESRFIGFYADKCVGHLACIRTVVTGRVCPDGFDVIWTEKGDLSCEEAGRIDCGIKIFHSSFGPSFSRVKQRFYLLDDIHGTNFVKSSKYGLWRERDFDLSRWLDCGVKGQYSAREAAEALCGQKWE